MARGELRKEILQQCPEEFVETLDDWISSMESDINNILSIFDKVKGLADLHNIEEGRNELSDLSDKLY